jgi:hypothetical protein
MAGHSSILRSNGSWKSRRGGWQSIRQSCVVEILFPPAPFRTRPRQALYLMPVTMKQHYRNCCGSLTMMNSNDGVMKRDVSDGFSASAWRQG